MSAWSEFVDAWPLFESAVLANVFAGAMLGLVGCYIVLRRMVFLSAAISQMAGLGVALGFFLQGTFELSGALGSPSLWSLVMTGVGVAVVMADRTADGRRRDALLGVTYLIGAAGTLVLASKVTHELHEVDDLLFGSAVAVMPDDTAALGLVAAAIGLLHLIAWRGFIAVSFDRVGARVRGLPVWLLEICLLTTMAVALSMATRIIGALPAFGAAVLPALIALRLSKNVPMALVLGALVGGLVGFGGYFLSFAWSLPVGASQVLLGASLWAAVSAIVLLGRGRP